jgi:flagellar protein FliS
MASMNYKINSYQKVEVETNDPIKLVIMLFEGAINFTEKAKRRMMDNKVAEKGILITKVMAIVDELHSSLDMEKGGEVAANMNRIYHYIRERLTDANMKNDPSVLTEVIRHFRVLKDAWVKVYSEQKQTSQQKQPATPSQMPTTGYQAAPPAPAAPRPQFNSQVQAQPSHPQEQKELKPIEIMG